MSHIGPNHQPTITAIFGTLSLSAPRGGEGEGKVGEPKLRIVTRPTSPSPSLTRRVPPSPPHFGRRGQMLRILSDDDDPTIAELASHTPDRQQSPERAAYQIRGGTDG